MRLPPAPTDIAARTTVTTRVHRRLATARREHINPRLVRRIGRRPRADHDRLLLLLIPPAGPTRLRKGCEQQEGQASAVTGSAAAMRRPARMTARAAMRHPARMAATTVTAAPTAAIKEIISEVRVRIIRWPVEIGRGNAPVIGIKIIAGRARVRILRLGRHGRHDPGQGDTHAE